MPRHLADERGTRRRRSSGPPRATSPKRAESCAMPTKNGRRLDEQGCFTPSRRNPRGENNREALPGRPPDAPGKLPLGDNELLSKKRVLGDQFDATANEIRGQSGNESKKVDHRSSLTPSARMEFVARTTVARGAAGRAPRDCDSLAPAGLSCLLDLEVPTRENRSTTHRLGACRSRPHHGAGKSSLGGTAHPRRAAQDRVRHLAAQRRPAHAASPETALADLANVPP